MSAGVLVVAKVPVPGQVKTRMAAELGVYAAAELAAAALLDTLDSAEAAFPKDRRVLALAGDLKRAIGAAEIEARFGRWQVVGQRGSGLASRLWHAHQTAAVLVEGPVVQVGMDTPQVTGSQLEAFGGALDRGECDAVIGPAVDGGWWVLGVTEPRWAADLSSVPMSTQETGRATRRVLAQRGARVLEAETLRDVDTVADAELVAEAAPGTRFAAAWQRMQAEQPAPVELFSSALSGASCTVHGLPAGVAELPIARWSGSCDAADLAMLDHCVGPTLDVGCGPGRLTHGLASRGAPALGIDVAPDAVRLTRARGAHALCRDVFDPVPGEGRWDSVLLADGNIGIGGDPTRLLGRVAGLLSAGGRAVIEVAPPGTPLSQQRLRLEVGGRLSSPFPWAVLGPEALAEIARQVSLRLLRVTARDGRWFAELEKLDGAVT